MWLQMLKIGNLSKKCGVAETKNVKGAVKLRATLALADWKKNLWLSTVKRATFRFVNDPEIEKF